MAKILFFNIPTAGHINATLPVVRELVARGHEVVYYLTAGYRAKIEATGATFRAYDGLADDYFEARGLDGSNPVKTAVTLIGTCRELLPQLLTLTTDEQPDLIMYDSMCPWGWQVATHLGIPSVSSMSLLIMTPQLVRGSGKLPSMAWSMLRNIGHLLTFYRIRGQVKRELGVKSAGFPTIMSNEGDITLCYTSAQIQPASDTMPTIKFVGTALEARNDTGDFPMARLEGKTVIYISLGTVINRNLDFYQACLGAFAEAEYVVVMSVGQHTDIDDLGAIPSNYIVRNFVPQLAVLAQSDLFITHAGMNSVHEGLYYDVPLLLVPQQLEQAMVAGRIQQLGAGKRLDQHQVSAQTIRQYAESILQDSSYAQSAGQLGESLRSSGGHTRAVDEIEAFLATKVDNKMR